LHCFIGFGPGRSDLAGGGAAVGTGGITIGAFLLLASICMGAQAVVILDMILAHKGFT